MGYTEKSPKGEISIENHRGKIRLRWRHWGTRHQLILPHTYSADNMHHATIKVAEIKLDILKGSFDTTLQKYKPEAVKPVVPVPAKEIPKHRILYLNELVDRFNEWTKNIRNINIEHSIDYMGVRRLLEKYAMVPLEAIAGKLAEEKWSISTYNKRLNFLSSFFSWLLHIGEITTNPLLLVSKRREKKKKKCERREPLTEKQITDFLEAIRQDTFCPSFAPYKHSFYYPFIKFIFLTGVRNAEAVGLKVKHVNFYTGQVEISETLARTPKGTNHAARISKGTKTENIRYLPLTEELSSLLHPLLQDKQPESLVFLSPRNVSIDDRMLQRRIIKPVLVKMGFGNRGRITQKKTLSWACSRNCITTKPLKNGFLRRSQQHEYVGKSA